jgi:hypothetical protein
MSIEIIAIKDDLTGETVEHVIIDRGNNEYTSMLKSTYDEMIAKREAFTL